jgi:hypothetical protein
MRHFVLVLAMCALSLTARAQTVGTLLGSIIDDCGRPVIGAELKLPDVGRTAHSTSPAGGFALAGLAPGRYYGEITAIGASVRQVSFEISAGRVSDIGAVVVGKGQADHCATIGMYRDVSSVRVVSDITTTTSTGRTVSFVLVKDCGGNCP